MVESNLPDDGYIEIKVNDELVLSTQKDNEIDNLDPKVEGRLEVAQNLIKGDYAPTLENVTISALQDDKESILFATNDKGIVQENIARPNPPANERVNELLNNKKLKAVGLKELAEIVKDMSSQMEVLKSQLQIQEKLQERQTIMNADLEKNIGTRIFNIEEKQDNFISNQEDKNNIISREIAQLNYDKATKEIGDTLVGIAQRNKKPVSREGEKYIVSATPDGDAKIWRKEQENKPSTLVYAQDKGSIKVNEMTQKDIYIMSNALEGRAVTEEQIKEQVQSQETPKQQIKMGGR